jgi:G3E family GTPase
MSDALYIMVGGFLGAGKTTAVLQLAKRLRDSGRQCGLITNDQSIGLVDTTLLASQGFPVEEITGGCFCCRFNSLVAAADNLKRETIPDVFIAEPVGSCTDLKATVDYPLRRMYGDQFKIAPLSVLIDPLRANRVLGLVEGRSFSDKVVYVYKKQLEEADIIVINKIDLLASDDLTNLTTALQTNYPSAVVVPVSARSGDGIDSWLNTIIDHAEAPARNLPIDYDTYADGEALLGWVNVSADIASSNDFDGNVFLTALLTNIQSGLAGNGIEIAHLKGTLTPSQGNDLAVANLVRTAGEVEMAYRLQDDVDLGQLIVNLRAESDAKALEAAVHAALIGVADQHGIDVDIEHSEAFQPGRPTPTHRIQVSS